MFAHSSIENAGIISVALGAGIVFMAYHLPALGAMAFVTAGYHMTNHAFYKTLLMLGTGAVEDRVGTRDLNKLGGLIRIDALDGPALSHRSLVNRRRAPL